MEYLSEKLKITLNFIFISFIYNQYIMEYSSEKFIDQKKPVNIAYDYLNLEQMKEKTSKDKATLKHRQKKCGRL